jgi:hypothetical protein
MACSVPPVRFDVTLDTKDQTREKIHEAIDAILRQNGAIECGIMAFFSAALGETPKTETHPAPELKKHGVTSVTTTKGS